MGRNMRFALNSTIPWKGLWSHASGTAVISPNLGEGRKYLSAYGKIEIPKDAERITIAKTAMICSQANQCDLLARNKRKM